ncbi:heavy-metal-associated domain-containing protein [Haloactinomyces albus]|uniref:Copper chaperone CopZ n=1 Tax=Haloactinomyces albus TaxID=1352928 RepID=A0AAE3ZFX9_9ACTN|nr:heavy-metal-associated domain-containing protein [Haloactinomyces albus]MDR7302294.1 copper chaperone CopZ [Haloactinomyces albus]
MRTQTLTVGGMTCEHCARSVTEELSELPGVSDVQASADTGQVIVTAEQQISEEAASAAVREAGYALESWSEAN